MTHRFVLALGLCLSVASCALVSSAGLSESAKQMEIQELYIIANDYWNMLLRVSPTEATLLGDRRYDAELPDISVTAISQFQTDIRGLARRLNALHSSVLTGQDAITAAFLRNEFENSMAVEVCRGELWDIDQLAGYQVALPELANYQRIDSLKAAANYVARLSKMGPLFEQHIDNLRRGMAQGYLAPRVVVDRVLRQLDEALGQSDEASPFLGILKNVENLSPSEIASLKTDILAEIHLAVRPAWVKYRNFLRGEYIAVARQAVGVAANRDGVACYNARARASTGSTLSARDIHEVGLRELQRLQGEMLSIARSAGALSVQSYVDQLRRDPAQQAPTREAIVANAQKIIDRTQAALPRAFGHLPKMAVGVKAIESFREADAPAAYYYQGSDDGTRPGYFYVNTYKPETRPLYNMEALTFHEAIPGHHLQIALAAELKNLPDVRRHNGQTAFVEGWALYAELLADELGLYSSPAARFGMLNYQAWRAARLVVDTGMHVLGWDREKAIAFLRDNLALPEKEVLNEIDRYIIWPGQALSYMLGRMEIQRLRRNAEKRLGDKFDLRAFHDQLLGSGAIPLAVAAQMFEQR